MAKKKQELTSAELLAEALVREEDWPYQVPANWVWVRFSTVCIIENGYAFKSDEYLDYGTPLVRISNIQDDGVDLTKCVNINNKNVDKRFVIKKGDLLIAMSGATTGKNGVYSFEFPAYLNQRVGNIKVKNENVILPEFRNYFVKDKNEKILDKAYGGAQPNISAKLIGEFFISLPPLAEQQRIVVRIESLFAKLDQAKDLIQDALDSFETRKTAILHQAFTGQLTKKWRAAHGMELESWKETKSESIFEYVTSGSRGWAQYYDTSGSVFIRMGNLDHGTIELDLADIQYVNLPEMVEGKRSKVEKNDILISITADVGMVGLVRNENMEAYINQHVALARPVKSVNAEFIAWFLVSDIGLHQLQSLQRGVTKIGLTLGDIRNLTIKLPCLSEQIEIVRIIDVLFAKEQNAKDLIDLIDQIEAIKKTILGQAFRGQLGTNVVWEESAVELFKEIL